MQVSGTNLQVTDAMRHSRQENRKTGLTSNQEWAKEIIYQMSHYFIWLHPPSQSCNTGQGGRRVRRARSSVPWHVGESRSLIKNTWQLDLYGYRGDVCVVLHQKRRQGIVLGQYYIMWRTSQCYDEAIARLRVWDGEFWTFVLGMYIVLLEYDVWCYIAI